MEPTMLERPGDLRTKSERMGLVVSEMMGLEMMLPKEEVERVSLRASRSSSSPACFLERLRLRKTQAMKATAMVTRTAPTAAPAITAVGVPPPPPPVFVSGLEEGVVSGSVVETGVVPPVEVLRNEEEEDDNDDGEEVGIT